MIMFVEFDDDGSKETFYKHLTLFNNFPNNLHPSFNPGLLDRGLGAAHFLRKRQLLFVETLLKNNTISLRF